MPKPTLTDPPDPLTTWRTQQLQNLGYHPDDADLWANLGLDWHALATLINQGCPPNLAIRILA